MSLRNFLKSREKRKRLAHIIAGFVILTHAYEKFDSGHDSYIYFTLAGLVFLAVAFFHPLIEKKAPWIDGVFFLIEGILSIVIAIDFFHLGKKGLPFVYLAIGLFQFAVAFIKSKKGIAKHKTIQ